MKINLLLFSTVAIFTYSQSNNKKCVCKNLNPYALLKEDHQKLLNISQNQNIQQQEIQKVNRLIKDNEIVSTSMTTFITLIMIGGIAFSFDACNIFLNPNICSNTRMEVTIISSYVTCFCLLELFYFYFFYSKDRKQFL